MTALKKRILIIVFTAIFILAGIGAVLVPLTTINSLALSGAGTESSPYIIASSDDLKSFRDSVNNGNSFEGCYFRVENDIDLKYGTFSPIGAKSTTPFKGHFDGNGHTINGLLVAVSNTSAIASRVGLFGYVSGATIKNITVENGNVSVSAAAGTAGTRGANNKSGNPGGAAVGIVAGGIVGNAVSSTISNCQYKGRVTAFGGAGGAGGEGGTRTSNGSGMTGGKGGRGSDAFIGGIVGEADGTSVSNCSFVGNMYSYAGAGGSGGAGYNAVSSGNGGKGGAGGDSGNARAGGIVGYLYNVNGVEVGSVTNCYSNAYIEANTGAGGYGGSGRSKAGTSSSYYGGQGGAPGIAGTAYVGGIVGESQGKIENCFAVGNIDFHASPDGLGGNGGYGNYNGSATSLNRIGASGGRATVFNYMSLGGIVGGVTAETSIKNVYSDIVMRVSHQIYYYNMLDVRVAGIAGVITASTEITNAVSLSTHYEAEERNVGNAFSPLATFSDNDVAVAVQGLADNIKYPSTLNFVHASPNGKFITDFSSLGARAEALASVTNLTMSGAFAGFDTNVWEISAGTNNGRPVLKNLKFKEPEKVTVDAYTRDDLLNFTRRVNTGEPIYSATINILADIDLGDWTPIGTSRMKAVQNLVINGNNHVLKNMHIDKTSDYKGFIGVVEMVSVSDLTIEDPFILGNGGNYVGAFAGLAGWSGQFNNCHVTQSSKPSAQNAAITGKCYVGGVVGYNQGFGHSGRIVNCSNTVYVHCVTGANATTGLHVGGLAGMIYFTDVDRCYSTANVYCDTYNTALTYYAGAFIGSMYWSSNVTNCFSTGNLTTAIRGSFIAYVNTTCADSKIENCYYSGSVNYYFSNSKIITSGSGIYYGGLVSGLQATSLLQSTGELVRFQLKGNVVLTKNFTIGGNLKTAQQRRFGNLFAQYEGNRAATPYTGKGVSNAKMYPYIRLNVDVSKNYYNSKRVWNYKEYQVSGTSGPYGYYINTTSQATGYDYYAQADGDKENFFATTVGFDFSNTWIWNSDIGLPVLRSNSYNVPGMAGSAIEISTAEDLEDFRDRVNGGDNFAGKTIKLVNDIDLAGITWTPIGTSSTVYFAGIFDGDGHTISNMEVNYSAANKGLFGTVVGGTVKNLKIKNPIIVSTAYANTGALAGWVSTNSVISDIQVIGGSITAAQNYVGGVIGLVQNKNIVITRCSSIYDPNASLNTNINSPIYGNNYVGGVVGGILGTAANAVTVTECYSSRNISGLNHYIGGLVGLSRGTNYSVCYTTGSVSNTNGHNIGGLVGRMETYAAHISDCFTTGDVISHSNVAKISTYAGGIVGIITITGCTIENCYVMGDVQANLYAATLACAAGGIVSYANVASMQIGGCAILSDRILATNYKGWTNTSSSKASYFAYSGYFGNGNSTGKPKPISNSKNFYNENCMLAPRTQGNASYYNTINSTTGATAKNPDLFKITATYSSSDSGLGWDFVTVWERDDSINGGYPYLKALGAPVNDLGSRFNTAKISTKEDFEDIERNVDSGYCYTGVHLEQTADIDASGISRIGYDLSHSFAGTYDGGNYKILNFSTSQANGMLGLFGYVKFASFKNINLIKPRVTATGAAASCTYVGGLIGYSYTNLKIEKCDVAGGSITSPSNYTGGLVGAAALGINTIDNCFATATVNGGGYVGGLLGFFRAGYVRSCYSRANVTGTLSNGHSTGGLIGCIDLWAKVYDCYAMGNVSDTSASCSAFAGGIIGRMTSSGDEVRRCYFKGTVTANRTTKATSSAKTTAAYAGGIVGYYGYANAVISDCVSLATSIIAKNGYSYVASQLASRSTSTACTSVTNNKNYAITSTLVPSSYKTLNYRINANTQLVAASGVEAPTVDDVIENFKNTCATMLTAWNINGDGAWQLNPGLNEGLPTLRDMPPDNSELDALIDVAKSYKKEDWNTETFEALQTVIAAAEIASDSGTLTDTIKAEHIKALNEAIANLRPDKTKLQELYDDIMTNKDPYKDWYTNYVTMDAALKDSKIKLEEDSNLYKNSDIDLTLSTLVVANKNLIVSKFRLNEAIIKANLINEDYYTDDDIAKLKEVKMRAVGVNNNTDATAKEVCEITLELEDFLANLKVDKTKLKEIIETAHTSLGGTLVFEEDGTITLNPRTLTDDKFEDITLFNKLFTDAVAQYEKADATGEDVAQVAYDLNVALNNLTLNKKPLNEAYTLAGLKQEEQYTSDSWQALKTAYDAAGVTIAKTPAGPSEFITRSQEIDDALAALTAALDGLQVSKAQLEELIAVARNELATNAETQIYDDDCVAALQTALDAAVIIDEKPNATSEEINDAASTLNEAILNLQINIEFLKKKITESEKYLVDGVVEYYTEESIGVLTEKKVAAEAFVLRYDNGEFNSFVDNDAKKQAIAEAKQVTLDLQNAIKNLAADEAKLREYIDRCENPANENYIGAERTLTESHIGATYTCVIKFAQETIDALTVLASASKTMLESADKSNESVIKAIKDFEYQFANVKADKTDLAELVREVGTWKNSKHRQDNDGKWILDEKGELKVFVVYSTVTWDNLQEVLHGSAESAVNKSIASLNEVETAFNELVGAIKNLLIDDGELRDRIKKAQDRINREEEGVFTKASLDVVKEKQATAITTLDHIANRDISIDAVQTVLDELNHAIDHLVINPDYIWNYIKISDGQTKPENPNDENSESNQKYYTEVTFNTLVAQTDLIRGLINDNISEEDVDDFIKILVDAMNGMIVVTTPLDEQIYAAEALVEKYITAETYAVVTSAVDEAKALLASGRLDVVDYEPKFAAVEDMKACIEKLITVIDAIKVNETEYQAFIDSKKPLLNQKYADEGLTALSEAISAAEYALSCKTEVLGKDEEGNSIVVQPAFTYYIAMDCIADILEAEKALVPDVSSLEEFIAAKNEEMNVKHVAPEEDEEGNIIESTVDPIYMGVDMFHYQYFTSDSYDNMLAAFTNAQMLISKPSDYTIEDVENELAKLEAAYAALELDMSKLQNLVDSCNALNEEYYIAESFAEFKQVLDECSPFLTSGSKVVLDYVNTYKKLDEARDNLKFDTSALDKLIEVAERLRDAANKSDNEDGKRYFTVGSLDKMLNALQEAQSFAPDPEAGEEASSMALSSVCNSLSEAINGLVDIDALRLKLIEAKGYDNSDNKYNAASFEALQNAIVSSQSVYDGEKSTQTDVTNAIEQLNEAIKALALGSSGLEDLIAQGKAIIKEHDDGVKILTQKTHDELQSKIDDAETFVANGGTEEQKELLMSDLYNAINGIVDLKALKEKLDAADQFVIDNPDDGKWTATSYKTLLDTINAAKAVYDNAEATAEEVATQVTNLSDLNSILVPVPVEDETTKFTIKETNKTFSIVDADGDEKDVHSIEDPAYLVNLALNDSIADILKQFKNTDVKVFKADGVTEIDAADFANTKIATGMIIRNYKDGVATDQLTIVLTGDVNGDGKVNAVDLAQVNAYLTGKKTLDAAYKLAANINAKTGDKKVNAVDMAQLNAYFTGKKDIFDGLSVKENS